MAYVDMARSHVKELVREGMGVLEIAEDCDGDLPFRRGTALFFISTRADGMKVKVWSRILADVKPTVAVLREVNAANLGLEVARVLVRGRDVYAEGTLPVVSSTGDELAELCREVGGVADELGSMIAAVHGGSTWFSNDEADVGCGSAD